MSSDGGSNEPTLPPDSDPAFLDEETFRGDEDAGAPLPPASEVAPETLTIGSYKVVEEIARGGMGVVYRAIDTKLNRPVALKMIIAGGMASPDDRARFQLEAEAAAKLDHPGITPIYEIGEHDGLPFFAMKLVEGGSLADKLESYVGKPKIVARLVAEIADAVSHAHQRATLHRDLKPNNILLDEQGHPLVTDFGLAKIGDRESGVTRTGAIMGTPGYMPPEQAANGKNVTTAADIYSLGAILFATLTGRPPFKGESPMETVMKVIHEEPPKPRSINPSIPVELELICLKCLSRDPAERYTSAAELALDLRRWVNNEPVSVRAPSIQSLVSIWFRENLRTMGIALGVGLLAALVATPLFLAVVASGEDTVRGAIYESFPSLEKPVMTRIGSIFPQDMDNGARIGLLFVSMIVMAVAGPMAVHLTRPDSKHEATVVSAVTSGAAGIVCLLTIGWLLTGSVVTETLEPDLRLLVARSDGKPDRARIEWMYEDLEGLPSNEMENHLVDKIQFDMVTLTASGLIVATLFLGLVFVPMFLSGIWYHQARNREAPALRKLLWSFEFLACTVAAAFLAVVTLMGPLASLLKIALYPPFLKLEIVIPTILMAIAAAWAVFHFWKFRRRIPMHALWIGGLIVAINPANIAARKNAFVSFQQGDTATTAEWFRLANRQGGRSLRNSVFEAGLRAQAKDEAGHRRAIEDTLAMMGRMDESAIEFALEAALAYPRKLTLDEQRLVDFRKRHSSGSGLNPHDVWIDGLQAWRSGSSEEAAEHLGKLPDTPFSDGKLSYQKATVLKSLVYWDLGRREEALLKLAEAREGLLAVEDHVESATSYGTAAHYLTIIRALYAEATELMKEGVDTSREHWQLPLFEQEIAKRLAAINSEDPPLDSLLAMQYHERVARYWERRGDDAKAVPSLRESANYLSRAFALAKSQHPDDVTRISGLCRDAIGDLYRLSLANGPTGRPELLASLVDSSEGNPDEEEPLRRFARAHPGVVLYKCADVESKTGNIDVAVRLAERAAESFGAREQEMDYGWIYFGIEVDEYGCFYAVETLETVDEQVCTANRRAAQILEEAGRPDEALALYEQNDKQFPHLLGGRLELMRAYCRLAPEKANALVDGLRIETANDWRLNRAIIQIYAKTVKRSEEVDHLISQLLAKSNLPDEKESRIRGEQSWYFAGPASTRLARFLQSELRADAVAAVQEPLPGVDQGDWLSHAPKYGGGIDFTRRWSNGANCAAFAVGFIHSDVEQEVDVALGSDDGFIAWLNGEEILHFDGPRSYQARSDHATVQLNAGMNPIVVQVDQVGGEWKFSLELEDAEGWPANVKWLDRESVLEEPSTKQ